MADPTPVVRLFFAKMKPEYFRLSEDARRRFMARDRANLDALGMRAISMIDCRESDDEWDYIGVEGWPSLEAVKARERFERETLGLSRYVRYRVHWGVEQPFEDYGRGP